MFARKSIVWRLFALLLLPAFLNCRTLTAPAKQFMGGSTPTPLAAGLLDLVSYISDKSGSPEIYIESIDGQFNMQVTHNQLIEDNIVWAPDGQRLLFTACEGVVCDIYSINADGSSQTKLTEAGRDRSSYTEPNWSPDGKFIAYTSEAQNGQQIFIMNADGARPHQLTRDGFSNHTPRWSPDGKKIAYTSSEFGDYDIMTIQPDGRDKKQLTDNDYDDVWPVWSPDAGKIAYLAMPDPAKGRLVYLMNADGTNAHDVSSGITDTNLDLTFSPRSDSMAFSAFVTHRTNIIYGLITDRWFGTQFSTNDLNNFEPSWAPDGNRLAYLARLNDYEASEIFINTGGTTSSYQLTFDKANISFIAWVPIDPSRNAAVPSFLTTTPP